MTEDRYQKPPKAYYILSVALLLSLGVLALVIADVGIDNRRAIVGKELSLEEQREAEAGIAMAKLEKIDETGRLALHSEIFTEVGGRRSLLPVNGGRLLRVDGDGITMLETGGATLFYEKGNYSSPVIRHFDKCVMISDRYNKDLILSDGKKRIFKAKLEGRAGAAAYTAVTSYLAVIDEAENQKPLVKCFNLNSDKYARISFADFIYPVAISFTPDGKHLDVLIQDLSGADLQPSIRRYSLDGNSESRKVLKDGAHLYTEIVHGDDGGVYLASENKLAYFDMYNDQLKVISFSKVRKLFGRHGKVYAVISESGNAAAVLCRILPGCEIRRLAELPEGIKAMTEFGDRVAFLSDAWLFVYDLSDEKAVTAGTLRKNYKNIAFISNKKIILTRDNGYDIYDIS